MMLGLSHTAEANSVALQDKNGVLPIQLILACAEAVWDALHFDGPGLEPEQRQVVSA